MKKIFTVLTLALALGAAAQKSPSFTVAGVASFPPQALGTGFGAHVAGLAKVAPKLSAGFSVDVMKFDKVAKAYTPIAANLLVGPFKSAFLTLEPGYGAYNESVTVFGKNYTTNGGFYMFGGVGYVTPDKGKVGLAITAGISTYGFSMPYVYVDEFAQAQVGRSHKQYTSFTLRLGVMLH